MADVHASRASVRAVHMWDFEGAERDFERAIELDPSYAIAYQWYAMNTLLPLGRFDEAWQRLSEAHELDPLSLPILARTGSNDEVKRVLGRLYRLSKKRYVPR